jgi:hypothetical protein
MAKRVELDVVAKDRASSVLKNIGKTVADFDKKHRAMSSAVSQGIAQIAGPYLAFQKVFSTLGKGLEEFEKRTGQTSGLTSLKKSMSDVTAQIGAGLYPAFQDLAKIVDTNKERFLKFGVQVGTFFSGLIGVVQGFATFLSSAFISSIGQIQELFYRLQGVINKVLRNKEGEAAAKAAADAVASSYEDANMRMVEGMSKVGEGFKTVWNGISGNVKINMEATKQVVKKAVQDIIGDLIEQELAYESEISKLYLELEALEKQKADTILKINNNLYMEDLKNKIDIENKKLDIHKQFANQLYDYTVTQNEKTYSGQITNVETAAQTELDVWNMYAEEGVISRQEYADIEAEIEQSKQDQISEIRLNAVSSYLDMASQVAGQIANINSMVTEQSLSDLDAETERKKAAATSTIKNRKVLEKELEKIDKDAEKRRKEIAKNEKKIAMIQSIVNTAQAVTGALAATPGPVGIAMAVIVGVLGAIQTGIIASQAFAQGGVVQSEAGKSNTGDNILVRANPGERVLTERQNRAYENVIMGGFSAGPVSITINGNADAGMVQNALTQSREQQMYDMRRLMLEMRSNNMLPMAA